MADDYELKSTKRDDNEATSTELNIEPTETTGGGKKSIIDRDNQILARLGKVPVLKVMRDIYFR